MNSIFFFSQLFVIISSISVPSFRIIKMDYPHFYCNYSTVNYHFGFIGNLNANLTRNINFEFKLESNDTAECSVDPNSGNPVTIYCIVDGYKYDISDQHNLFLPLEDPSSDSFIFENWEEKVTESTNCITYASNCPTVKIDYAFTFKKSPIKLYGCNGKNRKFSISVTRFNNITYVNDTNLNVYLYFSNPIHRRANCSVDLRSKDTSFKCEIETYSPKHYIELNSLNGDEINETFYHRKHVHIRGDELIKTTFEKCEGKSDNSSYFNSIKLYIGLLLLFLF